MKTTSIVSAIEELIYDVALWVILLPKTFVRAVVTPGWIQRYNAEQWKIEPGERYDTYMQPMAFWVIAGVLPYVFMVDLIASAKRGASAQDSLWITFIEQSFQLRTIIVILFLLSGPLGFSIAQLFVLKERFQRKLFQRIFYTQCMCWAPASFLGLVPICLLLAIPGNLKSELIIVIQGWLVLPFLLWLAYAEVMILKAELRVGWLLAFGFFFLGLIPVFALLFGSAAVTGGILGFLQVQAE